MEDPQNNRIIPVRIVAGIATVLIAVGAGITWWTLTSRSPKEPVISSPNTSSPSPFVSPSPSLNIEQTVSLYWVEEQNGKSVIVPQPIQIQAQNQPTALLTVTFERLLTGSPNNDPSSEIPKGTTLLKLTTNNDNIYVDLSPEFTQGGGSASMIGRLGQVVYTATTLNPNSQVWLSVGGKPLTVLGGEGLEIPQPITRAIFEQEFLATP
ncbi:MAG: GerMN domain-containing protein, partial [Planktothrix sp.]|uniref:GerMN domain-containing protein n=1 Tax=Planktothrix sp. TaxID=3088171 RepID=UPI0038D3AF81